LLDNDIELAGTQKILNRGGQEPIIIWGLQKPMSACGKMFAVEKGNG
jgi:hypothetical protein